jgi:hypothetical protein
LKTREGNWRKEIEKTKRLRKKLTIGKRIWMKWESGGGNLITEGARIERRIALPVPVIKITFCILLPNSACIGLRIGKENNEFLSFQYFFFLKKNKKSHVTFSYSNFNFFLNKYSILSFLQGTIWKKPHKSKNLIFFIKNYKIL